MKIHPVHLKVLLIAINQAKQCMEPLEKYVQNGLTPKRWRWDLLWCAERCGFLPKHFVMNIIYPYCNDDHLDTALRHCTNTN
jgi:hypothetical protein